RSKKKPQFERGPTSSSTPTPPDDCIIGEPSGWDRVTLGYKGRLLVHYHREQPSGHSAGALRAAPEHLVDFWVAVLSRCEAHNRHHERLFDQLAPSLRHIATTSDGLSDRVAATIGLRLPERVEPLMLAEELRALVGDRPGPNAEEGEEDEAIPGTTTLRFEGACPAFRSERTTPLAGRFVRSIRAVGGKPGFLHKTGTSDMNVVGPAWQCPIVAYGPGDSQLDHTPNEHLPLEEYQKAIAVLTAVLSNPPKRGLDR
ncbi:MAG: M20/M25/M40 family metallo-hydrolase, partial [Chloroflexaceae bacterium]|nr:M20/M25/M40 family metallo-hydrolase [Chloroflexaceae bacterium]